MRAHDNSDDELGFGKEKGPLYLMEWYRVILGEPSLLHALEPIQLIRA